MPDQFQEKFSITSRYIPAPSRRRSGKPLTSIRFVVAHDTGNPGSTAAGNVKFYIDTCQTVNPLKTASAHLFVDDREIIECIPALTASPEQAFHVLKKVTTDNELFGANANDAAIGVEYCYGKNIDADKAYARYVWVIAKICHRFQLDPASAVVGHFFLDPMRKTDPVTGLLQSRRSYDVLLSDIVTEYYACTGGQRPPINDQALQMGTVTTHSRLRMREKPDRVSAVLGVVEAGATLSFDQVIRNGERINNNPVWYRRPDGAYFWSGGVD